MGSSISKTSGAPASSRAIARRFLQPPDSVVDRRAPIREAGAAERLRDAPGALVLLHRGQGGGEHILDGAAGREDRILRNVADADAAANGAGAAVGGLDPGENPEEGGLAGAVRAHEAHLVSVEEPERQLVEERPGPVGLADRLAAQEQ